jgi:predicted esterase
MRLPVTWSFTTRVLTFSLFLCLTSGSAPAQDDIADIASEEISLSSPDAKAPDAKDAKDKEEAPELSYFLIGPRKDAKAPPRGYGLLCILPGGDGGKDFISFSKRIFKNALGPDWVAAQLIAPKWERSAQVVWPTDTTEGKGRLSSTEDFVESVIDDVSRRVPVDPARIYLLAWSSGGPAAYALSLRKSKSVTGFYVAMSVFKPDQLPPLGEAKGEAYFVSHSSDDKVCPFAMAKDAERLLTKAGAKFKLQTYEGGHGWKGAIYPRLKEGFAWLDGNRSPVDKKAWAERAKRVKARKKR